MTRLLIPTFLLLASAAAAQDPANLPSGSPLGAMPLQGAPEAALIEAQRAQQARALAQARARAARQRAFAEADPARTPAQDDLPARTAAAVPTYGQRIGPADDEAPRHTPSPYGGYYQIRTPWDRR